jgi:hypothetical protein
MLSAYCFIGFLGVLTVGCLVAGIILCIRGNDIAAICLGVALLAGLGTVACTVRLDDEVLSRADKFFNTREDVYRCYGITPEVCKYKKLIWQKDSIIWQKRMDKIIKK